MSYYRISDNIDLKEIGQYPQIEEAIYNCDPLEYPTFIDNIGYNKVNFVPEIPIGILNTKAKLTDSLNSSAMGYTKKLIISKKLKEILEEYKNDNFQLFESKIKLAGVTFVNYWILNPIEFSYENIDYDKSEIYLITSHFKKGKKLDVKSSQDLINEIERVDKMSYPYQLYIEKISLDKAGNKDFIIIDNVRGGIGYFTSERLKEVIESEGITGIKFEPV